MTLPFNRRRQIHFALFFLAILIQILVFVLWYGRYSDQRLPKEHSGRNEALALSNASMHNYFEAENSFMEYLNGYKSASLSRYNVSLDSMLLRLDSLRIESKKDSYLKKEIGKKKQTAQQIIRLRKELDSLLHIRTNILLPQWNEADYHMKAVDFHKVLKSIRYDSIQINDSVIRKNMLGRIGDAIRGKANFKREELRIYTTMVFEDGRKRGSVEDQMANIYKNTQQFYDREFGRLRNVYSNLREKDRDLLVVNRLILKNAQNLLALYLKNAQQADTERLSDASKDMKDKRMFITFLMPTLILLTFILLFYARYSYRREAELEAAKHEAQQNLEFKSRILGMLSHELRAPLRILSTISARLITKNTDKAIDKQINLMHFTSKSLQITAGQILEFFKKENSSLTAYNGRVKLNEELRDVLNSLQLLAENKNLTMVMQLSPGLSQPVLADNGKIHQLFYNIIGNAIKFTDKGQITVACSLKPEGEKLRFDVSITDTGAGIPKEDIAHIFDSHYQSKHHKGQISFGAGLGLNLCKEIIDLYDGEISVASELGKGTQISFFMMLAKADDPQADIPKKIAELVASNPMRLLAVDDDPIALKIIKKMTADLGIEATTLKTVSDGMKHIAEEEFSIAIIDLNISGVSGYELIKAIRSDDNRNKKAIIIAITGDNYTEISDLEGTYADALLIKPVNKDEFYAKLFHLIESRYSEASNG
ncbi:ATP-binding response regulator [Flavobacterium silvaticum]|uniref:histidine kinase n=1 Tax=Flavobacterium silvaticum TaxID=1852020 RepID=A0A972JGT4_9FLAO|nr:hybrid sensor histidine kinase/response regulator [Flavobacterium silvaticum]NMH29369.1 response regulator [Flavobacterium silvaticum]